MVTGENGDVRVFVVSTNVPFSYVGEGNELKGYAVELVYMFCRKYGYSPDIEQVNVGAGILGVSTGKYDFGAGNITVTDERKESMRFSDPIYHGGIALAVRTEDLAGDAVSDTAIEEAAEKTGFFAGLKDSFEKNFIREDRWKLVVQGLITTVIITVLSALFGTILAFFICIFRRTGSDLAVLISNLYVKILQGTPMVVLLMILYYVVFGKSSIDSVIVAIIGFALNFAAYVSEMMRSGIESIDPGQREAALALGFTERQAFYKFIFPQASRIFLPVYKGEIISLLKNTSIVGYIAIQDLTKISDIVRSRTYEAFFPLIVTALIYFALAWVIAFILSKTEKATDPKSKAKKQIA